MCVTRNQGVKMDFNRYSLVCVVCVLALTLTGCTSSSNTTVVNTSSGIVINSSDFGGSSTKTAYSNKIEQQNQPTTRTTGRVIHLGDSYKSLDLGPVF